MDAEKVILGLDIGAGSIGWGLVKIREEAYSDEKADGTIDTKHRIVDGNIIASGVRAFQIPQDREKKSLALQRGNARRNRKTTRRKARRLKRVVRLCREFGLIEEGVDRDAILKPKKGDGESNWDIWTIRKEALQRRLTDIELFRVMYHIAKHRGFFFHTKAEEIEADDKKTDEGKEKAKVKAGLRKIRKQLQEGGWETVGEMFCEVFKQMNAEKKRKRNARDKYENSIHRSLLKDEIERIFERQEELGNTKTTRDLKHRYIADVLMKEEGIDDERLQKMMSRCEFTGAICAPKEGYAAERFMLFSRLNTLEVIDTGNRDKALPLNGEGRKKIEALAYRNKKVTFAQMRTELESDLGKRFNLCSYREKNPEYNGKLRCEIRNGEAELEEKHGKIVDIRTGEVRGLEGEIKEIFRKRLKKWPNAKSLYLYYSDMRKELDLGENFRFAELKGYQKSAAELGSEAKYIKQFEDDTFVELKGYHKIKGAIEEHCGEEKWKGVAGDTNMLERIAEALVYHKSDETRTKYMKEKGVADEEMINAALTINMKQVATYSREAIEKLLGYMQKGELFNEAKEKAGFGKKESQKHPILKPYKGAFEKNPVVARVISQTRKLVNAIIRKYGKEYSVDQIHIEVATELASSKKRKAEIGLGQRRYRDAKEAAEERCREVGLDPEEGQNLLMFRLAEEQYQFCPYTGAKITLYPTGAANEIYIKECEIDHIIPMSRSFNDSLNNKVLCAQQANQKKMDRIPYEWFEEKYGKDSKEWMEFENTVKKLYRMPYGKRRNLLRKSWTEKDKERFLSRNLNDTRYAARHIADYLRGHFDFSESQRDDIKDVSRIQLRSGGITAFLRHVWGLNKNRGENDLHHATDALVVACSTYGHVYLVSNLAKAIERKGKNWYRDFGRDKFKPWANVREQVEAGVAKVFVSRMPRHTVTGAGHKETIEKGKETNKNRVIEVRGGYAEMGDVVRADVFVDGAGKHYVVPIYSVDIFSKGALPDKYVPDDYSLTYDEWPSINDVGFSFKFSLFKDDLIGIEEKNSEKMYYVSFFEAATVNVNVNNVDGSIFGDKKDAKDPYTKKIGYRPRRKGRKLILRKYSVDMLGNYREVKGEKRLGTRFESGIRLRKGGGDLRPGI